MWTAFVHLLAVTLCFGVDITDHPERRKVETRPLGQLRPPASASSAVRRVHRPPKSQSWILSSKGIPCHPFQRDGKTYQGCHPDGWCCVDPTCSLTAGCTKTALGSAAPLQRAKAPVTRSCELKAVSGSFMWDPQRDQDLNLMFLLLQEDVDRLEDEQLDTLLKLCRSLPLRLVVMSYKTSKDELRQLMAKTEEQLQRLVAPLTPSDQQLVRQSLILGIEPVWHVSFASCWLPSVTTAWSQQVTLLTFSEGEPLASAQPQGIRGDWATDGKAMTMPLRWAGGLCAEQEMDPDWPPPAAELSGSIALVARGSCSHYHKARSAQDLGAAGIVIFSHNEQPVAMSCAAPDPCDETLQIPVLMVTRSVGERLLQEFNETGPETPELKVTVNSRRQGPDLVGVLGNGGGLWYNSPIGFSRLSDELLGMEHRRQLLQQKQQLLRRSDVQRVEIFHATDFPGGLTAPWPATVAAEIRGKTQLDIELALDCEDHLDDNCPPWDHELNLYLCIEGLSEEKTCHDRRFSVARWVTPYGREALWLSDNSAAMALLSSAEAVAGKGTLHLHTWQHYTVSLVFWFQGSSTELPSSQMPLWRGGPFDLRYNPSHLPVNFDVPSGTQRVTLSALITGHGWGVDEDNCAEFCDHSHHFSVNGVTNTLLTKSHPTAGNDDGCKTKVSEGVVPNQYGTWPFGRAGWCPGQPVEWWEVDITNWLKMGSNSISYNAYFNGTDYDPAPGGLEDDLGFPAEIHVASQLTFYAGEVHQPVKLRLQPESGVFIP